MATKKQKRRRQKDRRHEWEYVYVDDEGQEVEVEEDDTAPAKPAKQAAAPKTATRPGTKSRQPAARAARKVDPPSWRRVYRRAAIFAPVMVIVVYLLRPKNATVVSVALQVIVLLLFFLPFSYMMDSLMYRAYRKRIGDPIPPRERKSRKS
jgi:hypothetical protein